MSTIVECKKLIIEGKTGSGKTYFAIKKAQKIGKMLYSAPCRQLVYESAIDYGTETDSILTGELHILPKGNETDTYCVYESMTESLIDLHDVIIIDEAHFLTDEDRGAHIYNMIRYAESRNKYIFLVTATRNFKKINGYELLVLPSYQENKKLIRITEEEFRLRERQGVPSIRFLRYKELIGYKNIITADTSASRRLLLQMQFKNGEITSIATTNVLAQGLNFPALNVLIEYNPYDSDELIAQKLGRLGRKGYSADDAELTYCLVETPSKIKKNKKINKKSEIRVMKDIYDIWGRNFCDVKESIKQKLKRQFIGAPLHEGFLMRYGLRRTVLFFESLMDEEKDILKSHNSYIYGRLEYECKEFKTEEEKLKQIIKENMRRC